MIHYEIRLHPDSPLEEFISSHKQIIKIYDLVVWEQILSKNIPTSIDQIVDALRFSYHFSEQDVQAFIEFLKNNETAMIEF